MLDVNTYLGRVYEGDAPCWQLVADVYRDLLGTDPAEVDTVSETIRRLARVFRLELHKRQHGMHQLDEPRDFAVVLMWPSDSKKRPHCGVWWQGKILHAAEAGNFYQDLASLQDTYQAMEWWGREDAA
jgi:hypothetical protein